MYPFIRTAWVVATTQRRPQMRPGDPVTLRLTCWPWDADMFWEMNNGRHLTLFDMGRLQHAKAIGLLGVLRRRGWGLVIGGSTIQYRKRIHPFQRFTLHSWLIGCDEKWFYFQQTALRGDAACSSALVRAAVIDGPKGVVPAAEVMAAMGMAGWVGALPDWASAWAAADKMRPWPPNLAA